MFGTWLLFVGAIPRKRDDRWTWSRLDCFLMGAGIGILLTQFT